jgi:hypothetical protein
MGKSIIHFFIRIKKDIKSLTNSPLLRVAVILPILSSIIMIAIITWQYRYLPPEIPLYYSRPWGEEQLAQINYLYMLPAGCLIWYICCILLIHFRMYRYRVFSQLLIISQAILSLGCIFILIQILLLMR